MATIHPALPHFREDAGLQRELDVLRDLEAALDDGFEIFHSVAWHTVHQQTDRYGEIDLVVMSPGGSLLLLEVKAGSVECRDNGIFKVYSRSEKNVGEQTRIQHAALVRSLREAGIETQIATCLVLPDYVVQAGAIVAMPRERIIDSRDYPQLGQRVRAILGTGRTSDPARLRRFLLNELSISLDVANQTDGQRVRTRRLASGLATWVPRISAPSKIIQIEATAGAGKTQLALRLLLDSEARSEKALYVCFNRSLADHMIRLASPRVEIKSFHELCVEHFRRCEGEPDFTQPKVFETIVARYQADSAELVPRVDLLIVDEAQDFEPRWLDSLFGLLKAEGQLYVMQDREQSLYERDPFELPEAVTIRSLDNFRSPLAICGTINAFGLTEEAIKGCSGYRGKAPEILVYEGEHALEKQIVAAIEQYLAEGFRLSDIAVLTYRGHQNSSLKKDSIGRFSTRRFMGRYSRDGDAIWSSGELTVESIYRFKGQSAPAIVVAEIDFANLDEQARRKLFVALTRSEMAATLVMTREAERALTKEIETSQ
jgi:superfamily I DNA/RNA helicase